MKSIDSILIKGQVGICGRLKVFLGFEKASLLHEVSFADVLQEDTGFGYQRPRNKPHSKRFKEYIQKSSSSTIPLTFNLREEEKAHWSIEERDNFAFLRIEKRSKPLAQVDCQHRLGELYDCDLPLAFMAYIGLDLRMEMALFNTINSNAKGLSRSLTDYIDSNLMENLIEESPHLYIAKKLNNDPDSPWYQLIKYGGKSISGLKRKVSLRMMQQSIHKYLRQTSKTTRYTVPQNYDIMKKYWVAVKELFPDEWKESRHHLITKGVGLYALMSLLAELVNTKRITINTKVSEMVKILEPLRDSVDWSSNGELSHYGGQKGAVQVFEILKGYCLK